MMQHPAVLWSSLANVQALLGILIGDPAQVRTAIAREPDNTADSEAVAILIEAWSLLNAIIGNGAQTTVTTLDDRGGKHTLDTPPRLDGTESGIYAVPQEKDRYSRRSTNTPTPSPAHWHTTSMGYSWRNGLGRSFKTTKCPSNP